MDHATESSVLGDFDGATFDHYGVRSRFFREDGKFLLETDGPGGELATFQVKYTFGVDPLQQYLVEFPDGRLQALSIAWDSRSRERGGQRWFHLYPDEPIRHDDPLHWTGPNQNWNFMCAECHSTSVRKNYDAVNDRFATTWSEISVGCEACHGAGSRHLSWARGQAGWWPFGNREDPAKGLMVRFDERADVTWQTDPGTARPRRSVPPACLRKEVETCGLCHARRGAFSEDRVPGRWLSDTHRVTPLGRGLFHADGQMRDGEETYNYAAFKQSRMFATGVTCSDCHEPHGAVLRAPGDAVCLQCHAADKYEAAAHHRHEAVEPPPACAACHMPERTYMVIDERHDHGFRIPRPDLSVMLGTPNACNDCHRDEPAQWAAAAVESWFGAHRGAFQNHAEAFHAAWNDHPDAERLLSAIASDGNEPGFVRGSALTEMAAHLSPASLELARPALSDPDPMVRIGALEMLEGVPADQLWAVVSPLLGDSVRGVRLAAVSLLAGVPAQRQPAADRARFEAAATEFAAAQRLNADRPEAHSTLGDFFARRGLATEAEAEYRSALRLDPSFAPAVINLADLYRQLGRDEEGIEALEQSIEVSPRDAGLHHSLGLALVRKRELDLALRELRRAVELEPGGARYNYVYAVALHSTGRTQEALSVLKDNHARHPNHRETLTALVSFNRDSGDLGSALEYAERLARISRSDPGLAALIDGLKRQIEAGKR